MIYLFRKAKTPSELATICKTPKRLARWMWCHLQYEDDKTQYGVNEYFATPQELLKSRKGDCEDYAWLAYSVITKLGFQEVYVIDVKKTSTLVHAVCAFYDTGEWYILGTEGLHRCDGVLFHKDIPSWMEPDWKYWTEYHIVEGKLKAKQRHYAGVIL